jgi:diguanylate cyclase (GGDEF)-like protein
VPLMAGEARDAVFEQFQIQRIRDEILPLFARLADGEEVFYDNPCLGRSRDPLRAGPEMCSVSGERHERCWQRVRESRRSSHPDLHCFPIDCDECPVYKDARPSIVEELGEEFNNLVHLLRRNEREVRSAMDFTRDLAGSLEDLDHFKTWNDLHGHLEGDRMLARFGKLLRASIRDYDRAFRFGGEEFVVLFPDTGLDDALTVAERIRKRFEQLVFTVPVTREFPEGRDSRTISGGVAGYREGLGAMELIELADQALYCAKSSGRNRIESVPLHVVV